MKKSLLMIARLRKIAPIIQPNKEVSLIERLEKYAEVILHFWIIFISIVGVLTNHEAYKMIICALVASIALINFLNSVKRFFKM